MSLGKPKVVDMETGEVSEQLELNFGEKYRRVAVKAMDGAINSVLKGLVGIGASYDLTNRVMNLIAEDHPEVGDYSD